MVSHPSISVRVGLSLTFNRMALIGLKLFFWQGFQGSISKFNKFGDVLRNLMKSLLRRLQDVIDGQATMLSTSQKLYTQLAFSGLKSLNKGRVYPKYM